MLTASTIVIISSVLAIVGSCLVIGTGWFFKDLRQSPGRRIITFLSLADLISASVYLGSVLVPESERLCRVFALLGIFAPVASFLYTDCVTFYLYRALTVSPHDRSALTPVQLEVVFHVFAIGLPALIVLVVASAGAEGRFVENGNSGGWCWISSAVGSRGAILAWEIVGGKFVEWVSCFVITPLLCVAIRRKLSSMREAFVPLPTPSPAPAAAAHHPAEAPGRASPASPLTSPSSSSPRSGSEDSDGGLSRFSTAGDPLRDRHRDLGTPAVPLRPPGGARPRALTDRPTWAQPATRVLPSAAAVRPARLADGVRVPPPPPATGSSSSSGASSARAAVAPAHGSGGGSGGGSGDDNDDDDDGGGAGIGGLGVGPGESNGPAADRARGAPAEADRAWRRRLRASTRELHEKMFWVPIVFVAARIWGSIRIVAAFVDPAWADVWWLRAMQAAGDPSQGFWNALLFVGHSARMRRRIARALTDFASRPAVASCCPFLVRDAGGIAGPRSHLRARLRTPGPVGGQYRALDAGGGTGAHRA